MIKKLEKLYCGILIRTCIRTSKILERIIEHFENKGFVRENSISKRIRCFKTARFFRKVNNMVIEEGRSYWRTANQL